MVGVGTEDVGLVELAELVSVGGGEEGNPFSGAVCVLVGDVEDGPDAPLLQPASKFENKTRATMLDINVFLTILIARMIDPLKIGFDGTTVIAGSVGHITTTILSKRAARLTASCRDYVFPVVQLTVC